MPFLVLIVLVVAGSIALVISRAPQLRSEHRLDSLLSREAVFLLNNLVLVGLCFVILWGTFFPLISEAVTGKRASVGPPWFGRYVCPLALVLVLLSGLGPVMAWRRATAANLRRALLVPVGRPARRWSCCSLAGVARPTARARDVLPRRLRAGGRRAGALARGARPAGDVPGLAARALLSLVRRNRRRYGGYLVHAGIAVLFVGIAASSTFQDARDVRLAPGERRAWAATRSPTCARPAELDVAPSGSLEKIDLGADLRVPRRDGAETIHTRAQLLPVERPEPRRGLALLRGRGHQRGRAARRAPARLLWTVVAPTRGSLTKVARRGDRVFARASALPADERAAALGEALRRLVGRSTAQGAAGRLPRARLAARDLDLARRADRLRRRADRHLAGARGRRGGA